MLSKIKVEDFYHSFINGAKMVINNRKDLNQINVFPVADGDTGSNLASLMYSVIRNSKLRGDTKETMVSIADSALIGARGNSGLIFAQYIQGWVQSMSDSPYITKEDIIEGSKVGVDYAYSAMSNPVEGTILSVMKDFYVSLLQGETDDVCIKNALEDSLMHVEKSVKDTTNQLRVLKKANVVDSGAKGFMYFIKGFLDGLKGNYIDLEEDDEIIEIIDHHDEEVHFRYCTEALITRTQEVDLKARLSDLGDSLIVAHGTNKSRIHIHTDLPHLVFERLGESSKILEQKVDDMKRQEMTLATSQKETVIVTDSIADLPVEFIEKHNIQVVHLDILIDDEPYIDKLTIRNKHLFELSQKRKRHPKSSQPTVRKIDNLLDYLLGYYQNVLFVTVASALSGTNNVILQVAQRYNQNDQRVWVIDSKQNSVAQGLIVKKTAEYLDEGHKIEEVVARVNDVIDQSKILVKIQTLDNMIASGRLSVKAGMIANAVKMRPIVTLKEGAGHIEKIAFGSKSSEKKIISHMKRINETIGISEFAITYVSDYDDAIRLKGILEKELKMSCAYVVESSSIIAAGAGLGAIGIGYIRKE
jgi:DegV family protein with EDD domain